MTNSAQKTIIFVWLMLVTVLALVFIFLIWNDNIFSLISIKNHSLFKTLSYNFLSGVLGGAIFAFRGFYQSIAEPKDSPKSFDFKWIFWYLIRPITGGVFGVVVYAFVRSELLAFQMASTQPQNNLMYFSISFLAGFGFHDFAEYLTKKVKKVFNG